MLRFCKILNQHVAGEMIWIYSSTMGVIFIEILELTQWNVIVIGTIARQAGSLYYYHRGGGRDVSDRLPL